MSPIRTVAEAACRVPEVQDINITEIPRDPTDTNIMEQENEGQDIIPELSQPIEEVLPLAVGQQTSVRDDTIQEPEMVVEHVPLLNGGPPTSRGEYRTTIISTVATTTFASTAATIPRESVSLSFTPQVSSTAWKKEYLETDPFVSLKKILKSLVLFPTLLIVRYIILDIVIVWTVVKD